MSQGSMAVAVAATAPMMVSGLASSQGLFSMIHLFQMYLLLPLLGAFIHANVMQFIVGMDFAMFSFSFLSMDSLLPVKSTKTYLQIEQDEDYLSMIGIESKSALVNNMQLFVMLSILAVIHLLYLPIYFIFRKKDSCLGRASKKMMNLLTFTIYIRMVVEAMLVLCLSSISEIYAFNITTSRQRVSLVISSGIMIVAV